MGSKGRLTKDTLTETTQHLKHLIDNIKQRYEIYKTFANKHHLFDQEWVKFWHWWIVKDDRTSSDYKPDWNLYWKKRVHELFTDEIRKEVALAHKNHPELSININELVASVLADSTDKQRPFEVLPTPRPHQEYTQSTQHTKSDDDSSDASNSSTTKDFIDDSTTLFHICREVYYLDYDIGELKILVADLFLKTLSKKPEDSFFLLNNFNCEMLKMIRATLLDKLLGDYIPVATMHAMDDICVKIDRILKTYKEKPWNVIRKYKYVSPETFKIKVAIQIALGLFDLGLRELKPEFLEFLVGACLMYFGSKDAKNGEDDEDSRHATTSSAGEKTEVNDINWLISMFNKLSPECQAEIVKSYADGEKLQDIDMRVKLHDFDMRVQMPTDQLETQQSGPSTSKDYYSDSSDEDDYDLLELFKTVQRNLQHCAMINDIPTTPLSDSMMISDDDSDVDYEIM
ncbi:unnamed protein product [Diamesa hyperborea]